MRATVLLFFAAALCVSVFAASLSSTHAAAPPSGADVTACSFGAYTTDSDTKGPAIYAAADPKAKVMAHLPPLLHPDWGSDPKKPIQEHAQFQVTGFKDGWFHIKSASYPESGARLYGGEGWIDGKLITTGLFRDTLKTAPDNNVDDAVYLRGLDKDGIAYAPGGLAVDRIVGCSGKWFEVEINLPGAKLLSGKPAPNKNGTIRGWTDYACLEQRGECRETQFNYPWSPLPAGITECGMKTISVDRDPKGLNVRAAPDANAPVLGQIPPPSDTAGAGVNQAADVQVIGYKNGWYFVEAGPYGADNPPPKAFKAYTGRGWVAGNMLTAELLRWWLKAAPSEKAANVIYLLGVTDAQFDPQTVKMHRLMACSGDWVKVEIGLEKGMKPLMKTDAPAGSIRGWANGTCTNQLTTCDFDQDRPWSPPAPMPQE